MCGRRISRSESRQSEIEIFIKDKREVVLEAR